MTIMHLTNSDLDRIARTIDSAGFPAVPAPLLERVVAHARRHGLRPVATAVLADARAPAVARIRAFGLVALAVGAHLGSSSGGEQPQRGAA